MKNESITQILIIPPFPAFRVSWTPKDRFGDRLSSRAECLAICARQPHTWSIQELVDFTGKLTVCYGKWTIDNRNRCFTWFYVIFYSYVNVYQRVESLNYWYVKKKHSSTNWLPNQNPNRLQIPNVTHQPIHSVMAMYSLRGVKFLTHTDIGMSQNLNSTRFGGCTSIVWPMAIPEITY